MTDTNYSSADADEQGVFKYEPQELDNDELIAHMLKLEIDKEHDGLNNLQQTFNGASQVCCHNWGSDIDVEKIDVHDLEEWDRFDLETQQFPIFQRGYKKVTKYNIMMNKSKNGYRVLYYPPAVQTWKLRISSKDTQSFNMNSVPKRSKRPKRQPRDNKAKFVIESQIDSYSRYMIYSMINDKLLEKVNNIINTSKKAVILHADCNPLYPSVIRKLPNECVIKVFQANFTESETTKCAVQLWAEKEITALRQLERTTVRCPQPIICKNHVVVMSFIGEYQKPAPKIKDVHLTARQYGFMYDEVVDGMKTMYQKKGIIHGNLSENTILWHNNHCFFIDFALSLERGHECGFSYLYKDCITIMKFFEQKDVPYIFNPDELFKYITGENF